MDNTVSQTLNNHKPIKVPKKKAAPKAPEPEEVIEATEEVKPKKRTYKKAK